MATLEVWHDEIHLIGAGGIGTHVLLVLIELGAKEVHVWDDDIVSAHNRPSQIIYSRSDVGRKKVDGMRRFVRVQGYDTVIHRHRERVNSETRLSGIVISAVDSMASRAEIWGAVRRFGGTIPYYIDGRIGDEYSHVMTVDPCDPVGIKRYERTLFSDAVAPDLSCTTRENPHSAFDVAKTVSINLSLLLAGEPVKDAVYRNLRLEARKNASGR